MLIYIDFASKLVNIGVTNLISIVIPALNVEETIGNVVRELLKSSFVDEVVVVDNDSTDKTAEYAEQSGANVVSCLQRGMGSAIKSGIRSAKNSIIIKIDGDIRNPSHLWPDKLAKEFYKTKKFVSSYYTSDYDEFPVGNLIAKPLIKILCPNNTDLQMPLAGTYLFDKEEVNWEGLTNDWSFDLALHLDTYDSNGPINQIYIGELNDRQKKIAEYSGMAEDLMRYLINRYGNK